MIITFVINVLLGTCYIEISENFIVVYFEIDGTVPNYISVICNETQELYHVNFDLKTKSKSHLKDIGVNKELLGIKNLDSSVYLNKYKTRRYIKEVSVGNGLNTLKYDTLKIQLELGDIPELTKLRIPDEVNKFIPYIGNSCSSLNGYLLSSHVIDVVGQVEHLTLIHEVKEIRKSISHSTISADIIKIVKTN